MTAATDNPWAILDELIGISGVEHLTDKQGTQSAFYGRCSTEDNQDPKTSRAWQRENAEKFIGPGGGSIVEEYFDPGSNDAARKALRQLADDLGIALRK